ncbi:MAG: hypothetical protein ACERNK_16745, partial [Deltaproteobacteria bacterium]
MKPHVLQVTSTSRPNSTLKARRMLGKYRIRRRIGAGAFATVYEAYDTIEGIPIALKVPHLDQLDKDSLSAI